MSIPLDENTNIANLTVDDPDDRESTIDAARTALSVRALLDSVTPELRLFIGLTEYDDLTEAQAARILGYKNTTTLRSQRERLGERTVAALAALTLSDPEEQKRAGQKAAYPVSTYRLIRQLFFWTKIQTIGT